MQLTTDSDTALMHSHARLGTGIGAEQEDLAGSGADGEDHAFAEAELHLPGLEVRAADHQLTDEVFRVVRLLDPGEDIASHIPAQTQRQLQKLVGTRHMLSRHDTSHAKVGLAEVVDGAVLDDEGLFGEFVSGVAESVEGGKPTGCNRWAFWLTADR